MPKSAMHVNVRDILAQSVGYNRAYQISGERPELEGLHPDSDIEGEITIARLANGLLVTGRLSMSLQLECHRCLRTFSRTVAISPRQVFSETPSDDELPIAHSSIDLAPMVRQELLLALPIKILCRPDCPGAAPSEYTKKQYNLHRSVRARLT